MKRYPFDTVRRLLETDQVTEPTKIALKKRLLAAIDYAPHFFNEQEYSALRAACRRLIPQDKVDCAAFIDINFAAGRSDGWRYDALPSDAETFRRGLCGISESSQLKYQTDFADLKGYQQDEILSEIQTETAAGATWKTLSAKLFFEELLTQTTAVYYAHPIAQEEIGYVGMADAYGWTQIKLNKLEPREPLPLANKTESGSHTKEESDS